jgi:UDP-N-acetyl-D-glucosamine dehydrogenase
MNFQKKRTTVCVQGLGFVGSAMSILIGSTQKKNLPLFNVYGLDQKTNTGIEIIKKLNKGILAIKNTDKKLISAFKLLKKFKNFHATYDPKVISKSSIVICNVNLDIIKSKKKPDWSSGTLKKAVVTIGKNIQENCLVIIETTVPPGTCEKFVLPLLKKEFIKRKINPSKVLLAHSFERVMPGENYLDSIKNYWRVFSANNNKAAIKCEQFYKKIINTKKYKLTRLKSMTDSEFCKILENTYRAVNIAFIDEWSRLAEKIDVDMFEVIKAIKYRKTHSNIMKPGFGVGGYCLTKDPLFGSISASKIFKTGNIKFPMTSAAIKINDNMPISSINILKKELGSFKGKTIGIMGITYRENVGDYRYSPANFFSQSISKKGGKILAFDPMVKIWKDFKNLDVSEMFDISRVDAIILTIPHKSFKQINYLKILKKNKKKLLILDAYDILTKNQIKQINMKKCKIISIGRGQQ